MVARSRDLSRKSTLPRPSLAICSLLAWMVVLAATPTMVYAQDDRSTPCPVSGRVLSVEEIVPADVLARVELLRDELDLIRFEMGEPKDRWPEFLVEQVSPRQALFQAMTLAQRADQLHLELAQRPVPAARIEVPLDIQPYHVWRVVDVAYERLLLVKRKLRITKNVEEEARDSTTTPTDVFRAIVRANREIDLLVRERLSTSAVFQQVEMASNYAARLLEQFPGSAVPEAPPFEHGKRPVDVYNILVDAYAPFKAIAETSGIETLRLEVVKREGDEVDPGKGEVYDIAILLVSELAYLHSQLDYSDFPAQSYDPGLKLPSHAYQQAALLLLQLAELDRLVKENPDWIKSNQP